MDLQHGVSYFNQNPHVTQQGPFTLLLPPPPPPVTCIPACLPYRLFSTHCINKQVKLINSESGQFSLGHVTIRGQHLSHPHNNISIFDTFPVVVVISSSLSDPHFYSLSRHVKLLPLLPTHCSQSQQ